MPRWSQPPAVEIPEMADCAVLSAELTIDPQLQGLLERGRVHIGERCAVRPEERLELPGGLLVARVVEGDPILRGGGEGTRVRLAKHQWTS